jgi:hypothetical protein
VSIGASRAARKHASTRAAVRVAFDADPLPDEEPHPAINASETANELRSFELIGKAYVKPTNSRETKEKVSRASSSAELGGTFVRCFSSASG